MTSFELPITLELELKTVAAKLGYPSVSAFIRSAITLSLISEAQYTAKDIEKHYKK